MNVLSTLRTLLGGSGPQLQHQPERDDARVVALETHVQALYDHCRQLSSELQQLRQDEARRAAEHSAMVDQLTRLYKRVSARIVRDAEAQANGHTTDDTGAWRRRLGK